VLHVSQLKQAIHPRSSVELDGQHLLSLNATTSTYQVLKDWIGDQRGGSEWEPIKILSQKNPAYIPITTPRVTREQAEAHTNLSRDLRNNKSKAKSGV
jgi:hypothetical protein